MGGGVEVGGGARNQDNKRKRGKKIIIFLIVKSKALNLKEKLH